MRKIRLIDNPRAALTHFSTIALGVCTGIIGMWATFPDSWLEFLPTVWVARSVGVLSALGLVGKFISQSPPKE